MENVAHTLLGISLAKAGLERATPLGTTALVISSNLPDVDVFTRIGGGTLSYIEHHRGITHSFVGLVALALLLTLLLIYYDRRFRLRRDNFLRPARPLRIFWLSVAGGLGHLFLDFTNTYGVRPLLPFDSRWFYGDLAFVVDPWIWLILGSASVWLTATSFSRRLLWILIGVLASLLVGLALREPSEEWPLTIPDSVRVVWFVGLSVVVMGAFLKWGRRGYRVGRVSLFLLAIYYAGLWMANQSAVNKAQADPPFESAVVAAAWPTPANPAVWQAVAPADGAVFIRLTDLTGNSGEWRELKQLDTRFVEALRGSDDARKFLAFARYASANVIANENGYRIMLRDSRFNLRLYVGLDQDLSVQSTEVTWF